jgi:hypothetical protein
MIEEDESSTNRSKDANTMHYLDARLVKHILKYVDVLSVHDCFGIKLCELHTVMDLINAYYSKEIGDDTYSIHILK